MNKSLFYTICTFFVGAFIIVWLFVIAGIQPDRNNTPSQMTKEQSNNTTNENALKKAASPTVSHYLLKSTNGKIGIYTVYSDGLVKLEKTLDVHLDTLRKSDRISFDEGIIIKDPEALSHIIEDYVS